MNALEIAAAVRARSLSAVEVARAALARIDAGNPAIHAFLSVTRERAMAEAEAVDRAIAKGQDAGPLAGVPYAVKSLFDVQGTPTLAGSRIRAGHIAECDATAVARLRAAGAVLTGTLNMDEFAYGFTSENTHYGAVRNPHDLARVAGGSSGGSAAALAAGMVPLTLGSDTNGSIRVPAAFCGVFGLKPTYGRLSRAGAFLFAPSLDHIGPLARCVEDLAAAYDVLQGPDARDPVCSARPAELSLPELSKGTDGLRLAIAGEHFARRAEPAVLEAVAAAALALGTDETAVLPEPLRARAAAGVITAAEAGSLHLDTLRTRAAEYDPMTRARFLAGALIPHAWVCHAQRFRSWYREQARQLFERIDILVAPATPVAALRIGQATVMLDGEEWPARASLGLYTQPISFIGLPVVCVPFHRRGELPVGVQLIGAPYQEAKVLRAAWQLQGADQRFRVPSET